MSVSLSKHLQQMLQKAQQLEGLVSALNACIDDPDRHTICVHLIEEATEIAPLLTRGIDSADTRFPV